MKRFLFTISLIGVMSSVAGVSSGLAFNPYTIKKGEYFKYVGDMSKVNSAFEKDGSVCSFKGEDFEPADAEKYRNLTTYKPPFPYYLKKGDVYVWKSNEPLVSKKADDTVWLEPKEFSALSKGAADFKVQNNSFGINGEKKNNQFVPSSGAEVNILGKEKPDLEIQNSNSFGINGEKKDNPFVPSSEAEVNILGKEKPDLEIQNGNSFEKNGVRKSTQFVTKTEDELGGGGRSNFLAKIRKFWTNNSTNIIFSLGLVAIISPITFAVWHYHDKISSFFVSLFRGLKKSV